MPDPHAKPPAGGCAGTSDRDLEGEHWGQREVLLHFVLQGDDVLHKGGVRDGVDGLPHGRRLSCGAGNKGLHCRAERPVRGGKKKTFVKATEKNGHRDTLCFTVMGPSLLQKLAVGGWRLAVDGGWRLAVGGWWPLGAVLSQKNSAFVRTALLETLKWWHMGGGSVGLLLPIPHCRSCSRYAEQFMTDCTKVVVQSAGAATELADSYATERVSHKHGKGRRGGVWGGGGVPPLLLRCTAVLIHLAGGLC